ncbi:MAG: DoxX family protein [Prevotellaceae bacterium]|jgi:uncharacterized membrane protein YphA (DoxX/SURF4 family)|nr:DoxX family protein [Prevotellaceae bacterium]
MNNITHIVAILFRLPVGALFVFSGFVKAIDPLGSTYKIAEYLEAFGMNFLEPSARYLGMLQNAVEIAIGLCLIMGVCMKLTSWALMLFMSFYTALTLVLAILNPVSDCGCFGDAIKLTNWQTFFKNLILFVPTLLLFSLRNRYRRFFAAPLEWLYVALFFGGAFALSSYCYKHLPPLDFMPYHVGQHLPTAMAIPEGAPRDEYSVKLIYAKDGKEQEFSDTDFPWQDSTWVFVDSKSTLVKKGYTPPVHGFSITHYENGDITDDVLAAEYAFLLVAPKLEQVDAPDWGRIKSLAAFAKSKGHTFLGLTASTQGYARDFGARNALTFDFCSADETTLKSMVRAHPGLMLLYRGTVVGKWSHHDIPAAVDFGENPLANNLNMLRQAGENVASYAFILAGLAAVLLLAMPGCKRKHAKR